jgi:hypothetical protein
MYRHLLRLTAPLMAMLILLAACGGSSTETPGPSAAASTPGAASAEESAGPSAEGSAAPSAADIDLGALAGGVSNLSSYQVDITVDADGTEQVMTLVATNDPVKATHYTMGALDLITIEGQGAWVNQNGTWLAAPGDVTTYTTLFDAMAPDTLIGSYGLSAYGNDFADEGIEEHNGIQARHYHLDASMVPAGDFPTDGVSDVWISTDGQYLVGLAFSGTDPDTGTTTSMTIDVSHVDDPAISIEPPI